MTKAADLFESNAISCIRNCIQLQHERLDQALVMSRLMHQSRMIGQESWTIISGSLMRGYLIIRAETMAGSSQLARIAGTIAKPTGTGNKVMVGTVASGSMRRQDAGPNSPILIIRR